MSATLVSLAVVNQGGVDALQSYTQGVMPLIKKAGGKLVSRYKFQETLVGEKSPDALTLIEFPNTDAIKSFVDSDAYKSLIPSRDKAFERFELFVVQSA